MWIALKILKHRQTHDFLFSKTHLTVHFRHFLNQIHQPVSSASYGHNLLLVTFANLFDYPYLYYLRWDDFSLTLVVLIMIPWSNPCPQDHQKHSDHLFINIWNQASIDLGQFTPSYATIFSSYQRRLWQAIGFTH